MTTTTKRPETFSDAEAILASSLDGYEARPPQQELARMIERCLSQNISSEDGPTALIAEAGTGTGKSIAYLIPAILSPKRVVVSTATKALQDQIGGKDLPFLAEHLGVPFSYVVLKGRSNYFCGNAATENGSDAGLVARLDKIAGEGDWNGQRDTMPFVVSDAEWATVAASTDLCSELDCNDVEAHYGGLACFAARARAQARVADLVVVNHALLFTDVAVREATDGMANLIGPVDAVVLDEAHEAENYATMVLGHSLSEGSYASTGAVLRGAARDVGVDLDVPLGRVQQEVEAYFGTLEPGEVSAEILEAMEPMLMALLDLREACWAVSAPRDHKRWTYATRRLGNLIDRTIATATKPLSDLVREVAIERTKGGSPRKVLKAQPVRVDGFLRDTLWANTIGVLVSATILVDGKADYIADRLGVDRQVSLDVGTPFDYVEQALLYVPNLPVPAGKTRDEWEAHAVEETLRLVRAAGGRALLLFTSVKNMNRSYEMLRNRLADYTLLKQYDAPNHVLAERFKDEETSVLFGVSSFFTGVDFQGDTLRLVVIDKMPFPVPTDPIVKARQQDIKRRGGNDFAEYTVPEMTLPLKQGFGRLVRTSSDWGVVAILDSRMTSKGYGKTVIRSLPDAPLVTSFDEVEAFLDGA